MEAFPAISLVTEDAVLQAAIPAQLRHVAQAECPVFSTMAAALAATPPALLILDCAATDFSTDSPAALRRSHPLLGLVGIGSPAQQEGFNDIPLVIFLPKPLVMATLLRQLEQLAYARNLHAGEQRLPLIGGTEFQPAARLITPTNGAAVELTDKESAILSCLYHHHQNGVSRKQLLEEVWGYGDNITTHTLETHLYRLRAKLREAVGEQELIATRNGRYHLQLP